MADNFLRLAEGYERHLNLKHNMDRLKALRAEHDQRALTWPEDNAA